MLISGRKQQNYIKQLSLNYKLNKSKIKCIKEKKKIKWEKDQKINHLTYMDDTILMGESKEELKSLLR